MRGAPEDLFTQARCCELLSRVPMAELEDGAEAVVAVVAAMRFLLKRGVLTHYPFLTLVTLSAASAANRRTAASADALDAVLATMRAGADDAMLQYCGCSALGQLAEGGYVQQADAARLGRSAAEAAVRAIVAAYRALPEDAHLLATSLDAVRRISMENGYYKAAAVEAGAIEMLTAQIRTHLRKEDEDMLHECFIVLGYLYEPDERCDCKRALEVESITLVAAVMTAQAGAVRLQRQGCFVLTTLGRHAPDPALSLRRTGALSTAISALLEHATDFGVQANACGVIQVACQESASNVLFAVSRGAVAGVIAALRAHPGVEAVQREAVAALCSFTLALTGEQCNTAGMAAAVEPLTAALCAYPANPFLQRHGCLALSRIIWQHGAATQRAVEAGAIEAVLAGMAAVSDAASFAAKVLSPSSYQAGCDALEALLILGPATELHVVCAVAAIEDVVVPTRGLQSEYPSHVQICARVLQRIQAAVLRHDGGRCDNADCMRCAAARKRGAMCSLPSCGARAWPDGEKLKRCRRCRLARYCSEAHQREHWPTHRPLCRAADDAPVGAEHDDASAAMERLSV